MLENRRLKELVASVRANEQFFREFVGFLSEHGYQSIQDFITERSDKKATAVIESYLAKSEGAVLYDGIGQPYERSKARWYFLAWLLRDAPAQRLGPLLKGMGEGPAQVRKARLLNEVRKFVAAVLPEQEHWEWSAIFEVMLARLEGSRRALRGVGFQRTVRQLIRQIADEGEIAVDVPEEELRLGTQTFDVVVTGTAKALLLPIKTRETMGGGHASLFTRDIPEPVRVAHQHGYLCVPIIIAESWTGDLASLGADHYIHVAANPNDTESAKSILEGEIKKMVPLLARLSVSLPEA